VLWPYSAAGSEEDDCNKSRSAQWTRATPSYINQGSTLRSSGCVRAIGGSLVGFAS
jgi:hypothetical protein